MKKSSVSTPNKIDIKATNIPRAKSFRKSVNVTIKYVMGFSCLKFYFGYLYMFYHSSVWHSVCVCVYFVCVIRFYLRLLQMCVCVYFGITLSLVHNQFACTSLTATVISLYMNSSFSLAFANSHSVMILFHKHTHTHAHFTSQNIMYGSSSIISCFICW